MHLHHDHADHSHGHAHPAGEAPRALWIALSITVLFMLVELAGGYLSNSLALVSDAGHMLTDVGAMLLSLFAVWMAGRPYSSKMSFGYHRVEILGALASGLVIWLVAGFLVYEAILRMSAPPEVNGPIVFVVASIGLCANLFSMRVLHSTKHGSMNVRAAYVHLLADSLGSVGAIVAGLVLWITHWRPIDIVVTFLFAGPMLVSSWDLVREAVGILMESTPRGIDPHSVRKDLLSISGVGDVHDLHIWTVSSGRLALSAHLILRESEPALEAAHQVLHDKYGIQHTTIQIEHPDRFQSARCYDCAPVAE